MLVALKGLKSDKTPGINGLSPEFIKMFILKLKSPLFEMITDAYKGGILSERLCEGIINLIPKPKKR